MKIKNTVVERVVITCECGEVCGAIEYLNKLRYSIVNTFYDKDGTGNYTNKMTIVAEREVGK